jgi:hypothetical protein
MLAYAVTLVDFKVHLAVTEIVFRIDIVAFTVVRGCAKVADAW